MKLIIGIPLVLSAVSFILSMLALFAGSREGFMEDYHVLMFNTSTLGQNFLENMASGRNSSSASATATPTATITSAASTSTGFLDGFHPGGLFSSIEASATALAGSAESKAASILNDIGNDIADKLSDELGIEQFYSVHVMDLCQGEFEPNATSSHATMNITECSKAMDFCKYSFFLSCCTPLQEFLSNTNRRRPPAAMDISALLDKQLSLGPFNVTLSDLGLSSDMLDKLNDLPSLFEALAAMYILSAAFTGLAALGALAALFLLPRRAPRRLALANVGLALPAALFLLVGSLLYTLGAAKAVDKIRGMGGDDVGLQIEVGTKFQALSWAAFALMAIAAGFWVYEFVVAFRAARRDRRARGKVEKYSMESTRSGSGSRRTWGF